MFSLKEELKQIEIGTPVTFQNLTVWPLLRRKHASSTGYYLLEEAIRLGLARVTEIGAAGTVPELRFENSAERPVLILDGEELIGAKQNRVVNLTILAPAGKTIVIPVTCVEAGRWQATSAEFTSSPQMMYAGLRSERAAGLSANLRAAGSRAADQGAVWSGIDERARKMSAPSQTRAMSAIFEKHSISIEEYVRSFSWTPYQAGVAFGIVGRIAGFDLFDHPDTMHSVFGKLVRSYALDAIDSTGKMSLENLSAWLQHFSDAHSTSHDAIGLGTDIRITGRGQSGAALWAEDRFVHVCGFATEAGEQGTWMTRILRPSRRR